ncbi:MAG: hypothetical protein FWE32_07145 [Oscillospiraceae bacterium]|nr:hypothetical protein [Oscillospiraceae bacterium]
MLKTVISYPHMGNYAAVFERLFAQLFPRAEVRSPPPITQRTLELGGRHSPDFVCAPFKYNVGNYIEALEAGANLLFQTGTGCRYGHYGELQEQILRDLGYDFRFACLSRENSRPSAALRTLHAAGCQLPAHKIAAALYLALLSIRGLDEMEFWMRENIGFAQSSDRIMAIHRAFLHKVRQADSAAQMMRAIESGRCAMQAIKLDKPEHPLRVGVVGELYTLMEPFSNFNLERQLASDGISVSRAMGIWFLLFGRSDARSLQEGGGYLRYPVGANGVDSVAQSLSYARRGYDGILHLKSFGCIPELNAGPALRALSKREGIPILQMSFDTHSGEVGAATRLEAFVDMIRMRKGA